MNRSALIAIALLIAVALGLGGRYFFSGEEARQGSTTGASTITSSLIGGPFEMIDHNGKIVTQASYAGRYMVVYFGYTFCPDVCPLGLQLIGEALDIFAEKGGDVAKVTPIFVTVDPERDSPEILKEYLSNFHPAFVGLSGSVEQMSHMAKAYRAYYAKVKDETSSAEYLMDHTAITYLMGPDGGYVGHFSHSATADKMAAQFLQAIK